MNKTRRNEFHLMDLQEVIFPLSPVETRYINKVCSLTPYW